MVFGEANSVDLGQVPGLDAGKQESHEHLDSEVLTLLEHRFFQQIHNLVDHGNADFEAAEDH